MVSTDPISDMFSRIRNASLVNKGEINLPYSKVKEEVAKILSTSGFINSVTKDESGGKDKLTIHLTDGKKPSQITAIKRLSRPGRRVYVQSKEVPKVKQGRGIVIISTSQGMMTGSEAISKNLGGELICEVY